MEAWQLDQLSSAPLDDWLGGRGIIVGSDVVSITTLIWAERASLKAVRGEKGAVQRLFTPGGCCRAIGCTDGAVGDLTAPGGGGSGGGVCCTTVASWLMLRCAAHPCCLAWQTTSMHVMMVACTCIQSTNGLQISPVIRWPAHAVDGQLLKVTCYNAAGTEFVFLAYECQLFKCGFPAQADMLRGGLIS